MAHDRRKLLRLRVGRQTQPAAVMLDGRTLRSTPDSGSRAGDAGAQRTEGSKVPAAVDAPGHLFALKVTAANEQERAPVADLVKDVQEATHEKVQVAFADQGYTGDDPADQAARRGVRLVAVKREEAQKGLVLLPRRWLVGRAPSTSLRTCSFAWCARFRRPARDCERLPSSLAGLHGLAFLTLMLNSLSNQSA